MNEHRHDLDLGGDQAQVEVFGVYPTRSRLCGFVVGGVRLRNLTLDAAKTLRDKLDGYLSATGSWLWMQQRDNVIEKLRRQADRPPTPKEQLADPDAEFYADEALTSYLAERLKEFFHNTPCEIDVALFATELLEYINGPRPDIEIVPVGGGEYVYKVIEEPEEGNE